MKPRAQLPSHEPPLILLVEEYLAENSNLSFINIEHMVQSIRQKFHRFQRLPAKAFENQVRVAYHDYCRRNGPKQSHRFGDAEISSSVDVDQLDSDSDVEELPDEGHRQNNVVNSCLNNLYKSATPKKPEVGPKTLMGSTEKANIPTSSRVSTSTACVHQQSVAGSSNVGSNVESAEQHQEDSDSDNDLQIVDEIQGDGVIKRAPEVNDNQLMLNQFGNIPNSQQRQQAKRAGISITLVNANNTNEVPSVNSTSTSSKNIQLPAILANRSSETNISRKIPVPGSHKNWVTDGENFSTKLEPSKGTKRKNFNFPNEGINEDLTAKKLKKEIPVVNDSGCRLSDFAGSEKVVEEVCRLLMHLKHPEVYKALGVTAPRGFLLHGPPGTGKTLLANAIAGELQLPMLKLTGTEFISGISGESERNIRDLFTQALTIAPCIIFIDEIDSVTPKRENAQKEMERRIVAQLLSCVDDLMNHESGSQVLLIGATNRIESIDTALRRAGRFDKEICLGIPDEKSREKILGVICRNLRLAPGFDLGVLAKLTPGYVGADLQALVREAAVQAVNKALIASSNTSEMNVASTSTPVIITDLASDDCGVEIIQNGHAKDFEIPQYDVSTSEVMGLEIVSKTVSNREDEKIITDETNASVNANSTEMGEPTTVVTTTVDIGELKESNCSEALPIENVKHTEDEISVVENMDVDNASEVPPVSLSTATNVLQDSITLKPTNDISIAQTTINKDTEDGKSEPQTSEKNDKEVIIANGSNNVQKEVKSSDTSTARRRMSPSEEVAGPSHLRWITDTAPLSKTELDEIYIFIDDFEIALKHVQPSSKREGFATVPDTTWNDIGALSDIREELEVSILGPIKHSAAFHILGLTSPAGVLLCGPPGCGKTLLAKAVANEAGINFISVKGPELLNMYVGESERAVRQCFLRAKNSSPCVIFFDEIDALCPRRSDGPESGSGSRIVNQLLTEMDGMECRTGVFVMAATNRPDILDPAILRPGRLDKILFVDLPTAVDRFEILKAITKNGTKPLLESDVDLKRIAEREVCDNYTGADLAALIREASIAAFKDLVLDKKDDSCNYLPTDLKVSTKHFETAFLKTKPSVMKKDRQKYAEMKERYSSSGVR